MVASLEEQEKAAWEKLRKSVELYSSMLTGKSRKVDFEAVRAKFLASLKEFSGTHARWKKERKVNS
jgi:hypothetical protein